MNCMSWDWCSCCAVNTSICSVCGNLDRCHQYPQTWAVWQEALSCQSAKVFSRHSRSFLSQSQPYLASAHDLVIQHAYLPLIDAPPQYVILVESRDTQISPKQNRVLIAIFNKLFTVWRDSSETRKLRQTRRLCHECHVSNYLDLATWYKFAFVVWQKRDA